MNIDLQKKLDLRKNLVLDLSKQSGMENLVSRVMLCLDFSGSMSGLYGSGKVQKVLERIIPVAMAFDDNGEMELFVFHDMAVRHPTNVTVNNVDGFIQREIMPRYSWGGTNYAPPLSLILEECHVNATGSKKIGGGLFSSAKTIFTDHIPTFVIFITDGENSDRSAAELVITNASYSPVFFQFVGIGTASFNFLRKLDNLSGRYIDNANFFHVNDLSSIDDTELYNRLLNEFPSWLKEAKNKQILV